MIRRLRRWGCADRLLATHGLAAHLAALTAATAPPPPAAAPPATPTLALGLELATLGVRKLRLWLRLAVIEMRLRRTAAIRAGIRNVAGLARQQGEAWPWWWDVRPFLANGMVLGWRTRLAMRAVLAVTALAAAPAAPAATPAASFLAFARFVDAFAFGVSCRWVGGMVGPVSVHRLGLAAGRLPGLVM